jgi:hypothetical protein
LAEIVMAVAAVVVLAELVGAIHLFRLAAVVPVMASAGVVGWWVGRRASDPPVRTATADEFKATTGAQSTSPTAAIVAAIFAVSLLIADWATRTVDALHHGMTTVDTLWYHMPFAARFVQQGTIVPLHYVDNDAVTVFFPASSELFHALGILFMGNDILSPFINSAWMALALLAAWCIGRPFGVAPVTVTGAAVLFAIPGLVATQPGGAYDDVVGLALLLSCAALLIGAAQSDQRTRISGLAVAALAAGVAFGTKFTFIAPVAALTIGVAVLARRGRRRSEVGLWVLLVLVTGGFWYLRNLVIEGQHRTAGLTESRCRHTSLHVRSFPFQRQRLAPLLLARSAAIIRSGLVGSAPSGRGWTRAGRPSGAGSDGEDAFLGGPDCRGSIHCHP